MTQYFLELKQHLAFDSHDEAALAALLPLAKPHFDAISQEFYDRLKSHPTAADVFRSEEQVKRLQASLVNWLGNLLSGPWEQEYFESRSRIGKVHVEIEMPQHFMFSAMAVIQEHLAKIAWDNFQGKELFGIIRALQKITNIDLAIMLESYRNYFVGRVMKCEKNEKVRLENRLEITQALYHSIFESSGVAIMIANGEHEVQLFNSMAEEMTGFSRQTIMGRNLAEALAHPLDQAEMKHMMESVGGEHSAEPKELRMVTANKSDKWVRWHMSVIEDTSDICVMGIDVTRERKLARQTRRVETLAALGTLAAGLAHEIRNPLNAAQLQLMLVERALGRAGDSVDARAMASSKLVKDELSRLGGLVEDFLAFARPTDLRIANGELGDLCCNVVRFLEGDAKEAGVAMRTDMKKDVFARVDVEKLKQVLINLLRNAIEAAGDKGDVGITCFRIAQNVFIEVSDSGPGIPEHIDIFEPFATSKEGGTGLGLPIVHRIVTDHGGVLNVERRGERTIFSVELPVDGPT